MPRLIPFWPLFERLSLSRNLASRFCERTLRHFQGQNRSHSATAGQGSGVSEEFIDNLLLYTQYEEKQAFSMLALLAPNLDYQNGDFHKDHLHPASMFRKRKLLEAGISESDLEFYLNTKHWNSILNLAHLDSNENKSKQDAPLDAWTDNEVIRQKTTHAKFWIDRDLPSEDGALKLIQFPSFIEARRKLLGERLKKALT